MEFSLIFKSLRKSERLTQLEFADKLSVSRSAIAQIESDNNKPSKDLILKILEVFTVSNDLKREFERFIYGDKAASVKLDDVAYNENIYYHEGDVWNSYLSLVKNKKIILCLCILLKEVNGIEINEDTQNKLYRIDKSISYSSNFAHGRIQFRERLFKKVISDLKTSTELIEDFTNMLLPEYSNRIRDFIDLFIPNKYEEDEEDEDDFD